MAVKLLSSSGGSVTLDVGVTASNFALTVPSANGTVITTGSTGQVIPKAALPTGSVLQVVQGTYNVYSSTGSGSYTDTGLSASITPTSSSSKVLILTSQWVMIAGGVQGMEGYLNIVRNSTQVWEALNQAVNTYDQGGSGVESGAYIALNYLDSPATTSSTTYKTQIRKGAGSEVRWRSATMILMEIAA